MDFDFSEDDQLVRDQTARFLTDNCDSQVVRRVLDGDVAHAEDVWRGLTEMGLTGTAIPEAFGGSGAGYLPLCLVAQELGAALAPVPFSSSVYLATEALLCFGSEAQKQQYLPALAGGELCATLAVVESTEALSEESIQLVAEAAQVGVTLSGSKLLVPDGLTADIAIVLARGSSGVSMYLTDLRNNHVKRDAVATVDPTRASARLEFSGSAAEPVGEEGQGWAQLDAVQDRAAVLFAFEQLGGAQRALDMAVAYANERFAFGRPIGSFQALKHMMADMYVALKLAESNCYYAAWALASDSSELPLAAATARVSATQAYQLCARDNIQVHGGMGFTWEFDCHLYYRRSNYLALQLGGLSHWESKLISALPATNAA